MWALTMPGITYLPVASITVSDDRGVVANRDRRGWRGVGRPDVGDQAVLHDDVDRPVRRLGVAVDHHRVLDHEAMRSFRVDRRRRRRLLRREPEGHQCGERERLVDVSGDASCGRFSWTATRRRGIIASDGKLAVMPQQPLAYLDPEFLESDEGAADPHPRGVSRAAAALQGAEDSGHRRLLRIGARRQPRARGAGAADAARARRAGRRRALRARAEAKAARPSSGRATTRTRASWRGC